MSLSQPILISASSFALSLKICRKFTFPCWVAKKFFFFFLFPEDFIQVVCVNQHWLASFPPYVRKLPTFNLFGLESVMLSALLQE